MAFKPIEILINAKDNASSVFSSLQGKVAAVGAAIATYFGINAFAGVVSGAADLETAMSRVQAATGATGEEMQALRKAAEDAGANTKYTSTEAAGALENLAKAGLSATDSIAALPAVLNLAQAGDIGLAESSELVTKAVMGMGLAFTDAGRVADVLALGANATNTSVLGLAQALSYAAPVAQSLGLSLESTVAIIGKFADAGIDASRAGTALNSILSQFSNPASKFREELNAAGITTGNFETALHQLAAAGPAGSKAINAVGQEAGPALRALLNQGMGALDGLTERLKTAEGSAAATAATVQNNLNGSLTKFAGVWDAVKNAFGTPVLPVLKDGVDQLAGAFRAAVADGTVTKFGEAIATAFQAGIKWVREFLATVDFTAVLARLQAFADSTNETFTKVGEYATNAGNVVKLAYGVMSAGVNGVLTAIYGIGSVFAEVASTVMAGVAKLREWLATVTFGKLSESFRLAAEDARSMAQGFSDAAQAMRDKASASFGGMADSAQAARDGFTGLVGAVQEAAPAADTASRAIADMARQIEDAGQKTVAAKSATTDNAAASRDAAAAVQQLRAEYAALVASGSLQGAAEKLQEINRALDRTPEAAQAAAEKLEGAFRNLGMTTTQELTEAANRTSAAWDTIVTSGVKSADVLRDAFATYANAAIAAAQRQGDAAVQATQRLLESKAATAGLTLEADRSGKIIVRSMKDAEESTHRVGKAAGGAVGGFRAMGQSAAEAAEQVKKLSAIYDRNRLKDTDPDRIGKSGDVRQAAVLQTDINQEIARRYGEQFVGDKLAEEAFALRLQLESYQKNYGNARSKQSWDQQRNIAAELDRVEREMEAKRNGASAAPSREPTTAPTRTTASGMATGTQVTINLEGRARTVNTDAAGANVLQDLLRELGNGRGTYQ